MSLNETITRKKIKRTQKNIAVNNIEIPKGTYTWRNQNLPQKNKIFTDDLFLPSKENLCKLNNSGKWDLPEDIDEDDLYNWECIKWERPENIFLSEDYQVFYDKIEKEDIIQGCLGNCYFLSAIASLCKYPSLIEKIFFIKEKSIEHCYGCYLRINGIWKLVLLDDYIPCIGYLIKKFAFSHANGNELWVILLEKAWAKINGNYARIIGGDPHEIYELLTNAYCEKILFSNENEDEIWIKYQNAQKKGFLMTAGTNVDTEELNMESLGLIPGHAYSIIKVEEINTKDGKEKLVNLRNPWGHGEWNGDWCDSSPKWTEEIRDKLVNHDIKDDGSFWMSFKDFYKYFIMGGICHLYLNYYYSTFHIFKEVSVKGPFLSKIIISQNNVHCFLRLHQKNPRVRLRDGSYQSPVLSYLMLINSNFEFISSTYGQESNITIDIILNEGVYYIISDINYRFVQKPQHGYTLSCYSSVPVEINEENNYDIKTVFKRAIFSYCKQKLNPKKNRGGLLYKIKKNNKSFPFSFVLFDNTKGNMEISLSDLIIIKGNSKNVVYYLENESNENLEITKTIYPGQYDIICCLPFKLGIKYSIQLKADGKKYDKFTLNKELGLKLYDEIFSEPWESLDDNSLIRQYIHITNSIYYLGIENISDIKVNVKLKLKGLTEINNQNENVISMHPMERKVFILNFIKDYKGEYCFFFEIV